MKVLMIGLMIFSCAIAACGEVFQMDRKGEATVEVVKYCGEYRIVCKFKPQTKFDKAVNARFNDARGDSLCKKGLARFFKVATNETLAISGQYVIAPVETIGERLCYSFGVPISGCKIVNAESRINQPTALEKSTPVASKTSQAITNVTPSKIPREDMQKFPTLPKYTHAARSSSYVCVSKYKEVNGDRRTVSHREYEGRNFKSRKEFDQFCQQEFARIRAQGEANLRAVRNFRK